MARNSRSNKLTRCASNGIAFPSDVILSDIAATRLKISGFHCWMSFWIARRAVCALGVAEFFWATVAEVTFSRTARVLSWRIWCHWLASALPGFSLWVELATRVDIMPAQPTRASRIVSSSSKPDDIHELTFSVHQRIRLFQQWSTNVHEIIRFNA